MLAEKQFKIEKETVSKEEIEAKAKEIFNAFNSYDSLCWLIAELDVLHKEKHFEKH